MRAAARSSSRAGPVRWPRRSRASVLGSGSSSTVVALSWPPPHPGPRFEQVGAGHDEQQQRRVARPLGDVLDELHERGLGPLQVIDDEDQRVAARRRLEHLAHRPEGLLRGDRRTGRLEQLGHARGGGPWSAAARSSRSPPASASASGHQVRPSP